MKQFRVGKGGGTVRGTAGTAAGRLTRAGRAVRGNAGAALRGLARAGVPRALARRIGRVPGRLIA